MEPKYARGSGPDSELYRQEQERLRDLARIREYEESVYNEGLDASQEELRDDEERSSFQDTEASRRRKEAAEATTSADRTIDLA